MSSQLDQTHDPERTSWVPSAQGHREFPVQNLPLGMFRTGDREARAGIAIGDMVLDLQAAGGLLPETCRPLLGWDSLNALFAAPAVVRVDLRRRVFELLTEPDLQPKVEPLLVEASLCTMELPTRIGDYTDFYTGIHHAAHLGDLFRPEAPLEPNYKWVPIAYHGRASSVRPSGVEVIRPAGQRRSGETPVFGPSLSLDYELEMGVWIGPGNELGWPIPISEAMSHIVGFSLLNDWSSRDIQWWEMQPLGPFLAKNFHTTISPWVVTLEALAPFRIPQPSRPSGDPQPLPHLSDASDRASGAFAIELEVHLSSATMRAAGIPPMRLSRGPMSAMYWTVAQMVAHHTSNGCDLRPGDLLGTGTISQENEADSGCLMEITRGGHQPIRLPNGETRTMLEDGDEVVFSGHARADGFVSIGFGDCRGRIRAAHGAAQ